MCDLRLLSCDFVMTSTFGAAIAALSAPLSICSGLRNFSADLYLCRALLTRKQWHLMLFRCWSKGGQCGMRSHPQTERPGTGNDLTCRWPSIRAANDRKGENRKSHTVCGCGDAPNQASLHWRFVSWSLSPCPPPRSLQWGYGVLGFSEQLNIRFFGCVRGGGEGGRALVVHPENFLCCPGETRARARPLEIYNKSRERTPDKSGL